MKRLLLALIVALAVLTPASAQVPDIDQSQGWYVQVAPGEQPVDMGEGEYLRGAAIGPLNFQPGPPPGDWAVYRSIYAAPGTAPTCHPDNPDLFEVPNLLGAHPLYQGRGFCWAMHLASNPLHIGIPSGFGGRPRLTTNHLIIKEFPNPDYGKPNCQFCGTHLHFEYSGTIIQVAFSTSQRSEVWYFKDFMGQIAYGVNDKIVLLRDSQGYRVSPDSNVKITTNVPYGAGNTPRRPGDEGLPKLQLDVKAAGGPIGDVRFNPGIFPDIPRDNTGHTYEMLTRDWLACPLPDDYDARTFALVKTRPAACSYTGFETAPAPLPIPTEEGPLVDPTEEPAPAETPTP